MTNGMHFWSDISRPQSSTLYIYYLYIELACTQSPKPAIREFRECTSIGKVARHCTYCKLLFPYWSDQHETGRKHLFILGFSQPSHPENYENLAQLGINKPLAGPYSWCNSALIFGFTHRYINKKQIVPTKFVTNTIQLSNYLNV